MSTRSLYPKLPYLGFGVGLRAPHFEVLLKNRPKSIDWLEILTENHLNAHQGYWRLLADLRHDYPMVMHGVSLSIGSTDPINLNYLAQVKKLALFLEVAWISDHLCFTSINGIHAHDLLPIPLTDAALTHVIERVNQTQDILGRPIVLENASSYLGFEESQWLESEFLKKLCHATGCLLLLDINNVYVSCFNHGWDARQYLADIPSDSIAQWHLAGHTNKGSHLLDTHDGPVIEPVWQLYKEAIALHGHKSTLIEWDAKIPEWSVLEQEVLRAKAHAEALVTPQ